MDAAQALATRIVGDGADYLARARQLGSLLSESGGEIEAGGELPETVVTALVENGLFRMLLPRAFGGAELPPFEYVPVIEELARNDASTAWCVGQGSGCSMSAAYMEPASARDVFAEPRGILAWGPSGSPCHARAVSGGYRLSGRWSFASGCHHARWLGAHVPILDADGTQRRKLNGSPAVLTLMFPATSTRLEGVWDVIGLRGTGSDGYALEDLFVPDAFAVARDDPASRRQSGRLYRFSTSNLYASAFAGVALGIARGTLDAFIDLARDKVPRGARRTMRDNNVIQSQVAQAEARWRAARMFLLSALRECWDEIGRSGDITQQQRAWIRLSATWAIHQARDVVVALYHAAGATAIFRDNPFERRFRDIHAVAQQIQGRQVHFETVGQVLLGLEPDLPLFSS